jgi:hypothetical protein
MERATTVVYMPKELLKAAKDYARAEDMSFTALVRKLLRQELKKGGKKNG